MKSINFTKSSLSEEIESEARILEKKGDGSIDRQDLLEGLIAKHPGVYGPDAEFAHYCIYNTVAASVRKWFQDTKADDKELFTGTQASLELGQDWQCIQKRYIIKREVEIQDGNTVRLVVRSVAVPVEMMTKEELLSKADERELQGKGQFRHADELRRLAVLRFGEGDATDGR